MDGISRQNLRDREEPPVSGHTLEHVAPAVVEADAGARHEGPHGPRRQDLLRSNRGRDSRAGMKGDTADLRSPDLALPGVKSRPHLEAELLDTVADSAGAADRARGAVEDGEEA